MNSPQKKKKPPHPRGSMWGFRGGGKHSKVREMSWTARESIIPTKGGRAEEGRSKGAGREEGRRKEGGSKGGGGRGMEGGMEGGRQGRRKRGRDGGRRKV